MESRFGTTGLLILIIGLGFLYQYNYLNEFPSYVHAWAQADRYALSLGFLENGFDLFHPQTYIYNHQFPHGWNVPSETTITAVDFPVHDYLVAVLMRLSGSTAPVVFRLYTLLYSFFGLYFLYRLALAATKDPFRSAFIVVFAATSPVFVYYQGGFLPTIPSLANAMVGVYFYFRFTNGNKRIHFWLTCLFLTLATLSRTTFAIPFIAVLGVEFIRLLRRETKLLPYAVPVSMSMLFVLAYWLYNGHLRERYGSIFLNYILPADNLEQAGQILRRVYNVWFYQYFTEYHYLALTASAVACVYFAVVRKIRLTKPTVYLGFLSLVYFTGCLLFAILMLKQFTVHDYYFLDTFFLPTVLLAIFLLSLLPVARRGNHQLVVAVTLALLSVVLILQPFQSQSSRRDVGAGDKTQATINNYQNSSSFLDSLSIPKNSKILVIDAVAPNIPFILMQRKGYAVMIANRPTIEEALKWDYDYIVLQNEYFISPIYTAYPAIISTLAKIADNGKISIFRYAENNQQDLLDFMGVRNEGPVFKELMGFENRPESLWSNVNPTTAFAYAGNHSGHITSDVEYGLTYKSTKLPALTISARTLSFSSYFLTDTVADVEIVVSIRSRGESLYYKSNNLKGLIGRRNEWEKASLVFMLPAIRSDDYEFAIYLWNKGRSNLHYDNFEFALY